jgi:acyl dehydratase
MAVRVGQKATRRFVVDHSTMCGFQAISSDASRVHCDEAYARSRGYDGVIVYGGIMLAQLSHLLGVQLPGANGTSIAWSIKYHSPLYVDEPAELLLEVTHVSAATGIVESRFCIMAGEKKVASGTTQSIVPYAEIEA